MTIEPPITEKTKAILEMRDELLSRFQQVDEKLSSLQNVTAEVRTIKELMQHNETRTQKIMAALKRAVNQFFSQI